MKAYQSISLLLSALTASAAAVETETYTIHGSGTTNPSKCFWHIMSLFEERSHASTRLTYRAVGSSTGQLEFIGADQGFKPYNTFGAGDIPVKESDYIALQDSKPFANGDPSPMLHLPFAISSVSLFVNIPGVPDGKDGLKLNACTLARIFNRQIKYWDHEDILNLNAHLKDQLTAGKRSLEIFVGRRVNGSSSTSSVTKYMNMKCPSEWAAEKIGSKLSAEMWGSETNECYGSSGMTKCIKGNSGSIGYLDSGHGWSEDLAEVNLENAEGVFITSKNSHKKNGIAAAVSEADTPSNAKDDWSAVDFLNKSGPYTWPLVVMSYVYVRRDITTQIQDQTSRGLLEAFLRALYKPEYFGQCEALGFTKVPISISEMAIKGIDDDVNWEYTEGANMWSFEDDMTLKKIGQGQFVISEKRRSLAGQSIAEIAGIETELEKDVSFLLDGFHRIVEGLHDEYNINHEKNFGPFDADHHIEMDDNNKQVQAALVLAALSFTLWLCVIVGFFIKKCILRV